MAFTPRFTIRQMMLAMVVVAAISAIFGLASRGSFIAYGLAAGVATLIFPFLVYALVYWIGWLIVGRGVDTLPTEFGIESSTPKTEENQE